MNRILPLALVATSALGNNQEQGLRGLATVAATVQKKLPQPGDLACDVNLLFPAIDALAEEKGKWCDFSTIMEKEFNHLSRNEQTEHLEGICKTGCSEDFEKTVAAWRNDCMETGFKHSWFSVLSMGCAEDPQLGLCANAFQGAWELHTQGKYDCDYFTSCCFGEQSKIDTWAPSDVEEKCPGALGAKELSCKGKPVWKPTPATQATPAPVAPAATATITPVAQVVATPAPKAAPAVAPVAQPKAQATTTTTTTTTKTATAPQAKAGKKL